MVDVQRPRDGVRQLRAERGGGAGGPVRAHRCLALGHGRRAGTIQVWRPPAHAAADGFEGGGGGRRHLVDVGALSAYLARRDFEHLVAEDEALQTQETIFC